jgi:hypothetical protein
MSKIISKEIEFAVVSPGGVATTSLIHFFALHHAVNAPNDEDSLKHMPIPPVSFNPNFKFIHIFGDPVAATISLFRRKFQELQSKKLQRGTNLRCPIPIEMSLEEYAAHGKDRLLFENFFTNYYSTHLLYPTLFIRYEHLWENLDAIRDFLNLPTEEFETFPRKLIRETEKQTIDSRVIVRLKQMYSGFYKKTEGLPGAFVRGGDLCPTPVSILSSQSLRKAIINGVTSRVLGFPSTYGT